MKASRSNVCEDSVTISLKYSNRTLYAKNPLGIISFKYLPSTGDLIIRFRFCNSHPDLNEYLEYAKLVRAELIHVIHHFTHQLPVDSKLKIFSEITE